VGPPAAVLGIEVALMARCSSVRPLLVSSAPFRTAFVVFGGLAVLQSSPELSAVKLVYLVGVGIAFVAALLNLRYLESTRAYCLLRPLLGLSSLFALLVGLSLGVSLAHGASATAWFRDAAPYLLFASVPVFALDLESSVPRRLCLTMFVIAGVLASLSYAVEWLNRRELAELPLSRIVLPSGSLRSALYVYALSGALLGGRRRTEWMALGAFILSLTWITGNRADGFLLLLVLPVVGAFAVKGPAHPADAALRAALIGGAAFVLTLVLAQSLATVSDLDTSALADRYRTMTGVPASWEADGSYVERQDETDLAWRTFLSEPVLGAGPGHAFEWSTAKGVQKASFNIDTALSFPAKFGIAGVVLLLAVVLAFALSARDAGRGAGLSIPQVALFGYAVLAILSLPFSSPLEDKGFSFGLLFLLALGLPEEGETRNDDASQRPRMRESYGSV
jgi:hypothetical protein